MAKIDKGGPETWLTPQNDGLDYTNPDVTTQAELDAFNAWHARMKGHRMSYGDFWAAFRPDVLKRYRRSVREATVEEEFPFMPHALAMLHYYAVWGWGEGILNQIRMGHSGGVTRGEILDVLAISFLQYTPRGQIITADTVTDFLQEWKEPEPQPHWPDSWSFDPHAFDSGVDYSSPEATRDDVDKILGWYRNTLGEVPRYVAFFAKHRPRVLKAYRNRFENAIRGGLPKEMMPYLLLHYNTVRGFRDGIRESVLLARALQMPRSHVLDAVSWALWYGGTDSVSIFEESAGTIFESLTD